MLRVVESKKRVNYLQNNILATIFFEPSTRTRLSFESAIQKLGGGVLSVADSKSSSDSKGESLQDTIRVVSSWSDAIVLRHSLEGAAEIASQNSNVPVINAGDGAGEHPTQALLDLFTIQREKGRITELNVAIVGDLKYGRTVHSLAYVLSLFNNTITFIAPKALWLPDQIYMDLKLKYNNHMTTSESLESALNVDVIYMTRIQKERFSDPEEYAKFATSYTIDKDFLAIAAKDVKIMHPLPRITEISPEIDHKEQSVYFKQAAYGLPVRMAILNMILGTESNAQ